MGRSFSAGDGRGRAVGLELDIRSWPILAVPDGQDQVLRGDGVDDVGGRQTLGLQRLDVEVDLNLALLAAIRIRDLRALHGGELGTDEVQAEVVQLLLGESLAGEAKLQNRDAGGVELDDQRRRGAWRERAQGGLRDGGDLGDRVRDLDARLKIDLDDRNAVERLRLDVLDIVDGRGEGAFRNGDDAVRHVRRREAGVVPDDADDGDIDIGENVGRRIEDGERPEDQKKNCENDEGVRPSEGKADNPHFLEFLLNPQKAQILYGPAVRDAGAALLSDLFAIPPVDSSGGAR